MVRDLILILYINTFFLHGGYVYYDRDSALYRMDLVTGKQEIYLKGISVTYSYDGRNLYYTDSYNRLVIRDLDSGKERVTDEVVAYRFTLTPEGIYFLNIRDNDTLYYWDEGSDTVVKLDDTRGYAIYWDEDYLWLGDSESFQLHRMDHGGSNKVVVDPQVVPGFRTFCVPPDGAYLYVLDSDSGEVHAVNKADFTEEILRVG